MDQSPGEYTDKELYARPFVRSLENNIDGTKIFIIILLVFAGRDRSV
jgi:hypothetical protein